MPLQLLKSQEKVEGCTRSRRERENKPQIAEGPRLYSQKEDALTTGKTLTTAKEGSCCLMTASRVA
jgi:hypothetical protein